MARQPPLNEEALVKLGSEKLARLVIGEAKRNTAFRKLVAAALAATKGPAAVAAIIDKRLAGLDRESRACACERWLASGGFYRAFESRLPVTMRQTHAAGERLFVDYAGDGVPVVIDWLTGEIRKGQIFVAVLGASSFTYARATWTQTLIDWIDAHVQTFGAIGGAPHLLVPANTKAAVVKACLYDPLVNRTYADMAAHYGTAILPARPRRPRDKAKVEQAVLIVERWLLGRLRHRR